MAKFGLYDPGSSKPLQEYEGDFLVLNPQGETVAVVEQNNNHTVAVIRLAERQSVKKVG
jgi:hypothetical protein